MAYMAMEETKVYQMAVEVADEIYFVVDRWPWFAQSSFGLQLVRAADSVASNLVEGDARSSDSDSVRFFRYSRGSAREAVHWLNRAKVRKVMDAEQVQIHIRKLDECRRMINGVISYRKSAERGGFAKENQALYGGCPLTEEF